MAYTRYIWGQEAWDELVRDGLGVIIDPMVLRVGQLFLEGGASDHGDNDVRWSAIESDVGALAAFFDLVVLYRRFPAFNYQDTFDPGPNIADPLGEVLNAGGDDVLEHVDVEHRMYREAKTAALDELGSRLTYGPLLTRKVAEEILVVLKAMRWEWAPSLETVEPLLVDDHDARLARFILGQLVFSGYAQQTGAPHVLAPKRSRLLAAIGLQSSSAGSKAEATVYEELRRRAADTGGWRVRELPWTPSFLPFLVDRSRASRYTNGPDVLLEKAKELRDSNAVDRYRALRMGVSSEDQERSAEARRELEAAAGAVARSLDAESERLHVFRQVAVEAMPKLGGVGLGAAAGSILGGPPGAAAGAVGGLVAEHAITHAQDRLWGWYLEKLTFRRARKLLTRAITAEFETQGAFVDDLRIIWETPLR